jgi:hypothetical protein
VLGMMGVEPEGFEPPPASEVPEHWSASRRQEANLGALAVLAKLPEGRTPSPAQREALLQYSGWGGLSIRKVRDRLPANLPEPEDFGLVHEYYTPYRVWASVARWLWSSGLADGLGQDGPVRALEPSAGIGRALRAFTGFPKPVGWTAVEFSALSSRMLAAAYPEAHVSHAPFERWAGEHPRARFDLVVSNPPYGVRNEAAAEDPLWHAYETSRAYVYFLRRTLDLLRPGGIGVYVIPTGFLRSGSAEFMRVREEVLKRHHLLAAFRLPSQAAEGDAKNLAVYDQFPTDLLIFQARQSGPLIDLPDNDKLLIAKDGYFTLFPDHMLGEETGRETEGWDPSQPVGRRGYQVIGSFTDLPASFALREEEFGPVADQPREAKAAANGGLVRRVKRLAQDAAPSHRTAEALGLRADEILAGISRQDAKVASGWKEMSRDLLAWKRLHGNPTNATLRALGQAGYTGIQRFLAVWKGNGTLVEALCHEPQIQHRYQGAWSILAVADWLYRHRLGVMSMDDLGAFFAQAGHPAPSRQDIREQLLPAGWCLDGDGWDELVPDRDYFTGFLWPRVDRAQVRAQEGDEAAKSQLDRLRKTIGWRSGPSILEECLPVDSWLDLGIVSAFVSEVLQGPRPLPKKKAHDRQEYTPAEPPVTLERADGFLQVVGMPYESLINTDKNRTPGFSRMALSFLGWANQDKGLTNPVRAEIIDGETGERSKEPKSQAQARENEEVLEQWKKWLGENPQHLDVLESDYNRNLRGYVPPTYSDEPLNAARWVDRRHTDKPILLHGYQNQAARRIIENRTGLLAFDTGLGKTYTGIATMAMAKQQGWANRPVVVVPNSIVWKWYRDITRCLPDYRILVIGSKQYHSNKKDRTAASPDTPEERAAKWTAFQAGEADVVLLTYQALSRTKIDAKFLEDYVATTIATRREIALSIDKGQKADASKRISAIKKEMSTRAKGGVGSLRGSLAELEAELDQLQGKGDDDSGAGKQVSERREAEIRARTRKWVAEVLRPPKTWKHDPGIDWHALGIDFLMVDEAQNFKNLFYSARNGEKTDTKRAWALDFRCASVRAHTGGTGVVLLSATPAKNDPVEFYNLLHYLSPTVWNQVFVDNHEAFLNRYGNYVRRDVPDATGQNLVEREVMVSFRNLDELRGVVYRWAEFKVADDVGLKIPDAVRHVHNVDLTVGQIAVLQGYIRELVDVDDKLKKIMQRGGKEDGETAKIVKALQDKKRALNLKVYLSNIHPDLPGYGKSGADEVDLADAPKLQDCADTIMETRKRACNADGSFCLECGHIIFAESPYVHGWMRDILIERGIAPERIAILNAQEASDTELRQQISEQFNGVGNPEDDDYEEPRFDVVIANAIAYEGVDLQRRTCAIHHIDVPWDPSTLQQRNGRGVRQGNKFAVVDIHYYFVRGSNELQRIERIERKRGWMASLVEGQARATNTTLDDDEDISVSIEDLAMRYASDEDREKMAAAKAERQAREAAEKQTRAQTQANRTLRSIDAMFRRVDREENPETAGMMREDAEDSLAVLLANYPDALWGTVPWKASARRVRETSLFIPDQGLPVMLGDVFTLPPASEGGEPMALQATVMGSRVVDDKKVDGLFARRPNTIEARYFYAVNTPFRATGYAAPWPEEDMKQLVEDAKSSFVGPVTNPYEWSRGGWERVPEPLRSRVWPAIEAGQRAAKRPSWGNLGGPFWDRWGASMAEPEDLRIPIIDGSGRLVLMRRTDDDVPRMPGDAFLIPPTEEGWTSFLKLAQRFGGKDDLTYTQLNLAAKTWWQDRKFPLGFFKEKE